MDPKKALYHLMDRYQHSGYLASVQQAPGAGVLNAEPEVRAALKKLTSDDIAMLRPSENVFYLEKHMIRKY